ncbi:MAG: DUF305 domain-containing protein [Pseudonocardia sp.]|nr:DUF305 domain-containing protein [Pseudonocardia sp.]
MSTVEGRDVAAALSEVGLDGPAAPHSTWVRYLLVASAAAALLLLGDAAGVLIGLPRSTPATPSVLSSDSVDVGFAQDMSVHHEQAVEMATWERDHTADPRLRQLAYDIESTQSRQIGHLQGWLALWGAAAMPDGRYMRWMSIGPGAHDHAPAPGGSPGRAQMPGMATSDELRQLRASSGPAMDTMFLQLMLRHHEGGTGMLAYAAQYAEIGDVRNLASQMLTAQTAESQYMRQLLAERGAVPLPN